jgi:hypothetical protein
LRRVGIGERDEALELRGTAVALQLLDGFDRDLGALEPTVVECFHELPPHRLLIDRSVATDRNVRPARCLADLVLDDPGVAAQRGAKQMRVHLPVAVLEDVIEPALDVADAPHRGSAPAELT